MYHGTRVRHLAAAAAGGLQAPRSDEDQKPRSYFISSRTAARARRGFVLSRTSCCHRTAAAAGLLGRRNRSLGAPMMGAAHTAATGMHALVLLLLLLAQSMCAVQAGVYTCVHSQNGCTRTCTRTAVRAPVSRMRSVRVLFFVQRIVDLEVARLQ